MSKINEHLLVEKFITEFFNDFKCFTNQREVSIGKKSNDVFSQTKYAPTLVSDVLLSNSGQVMEALTSPTAHREIDYERLEFLGDSMISFLVILELFLTKE